MGKKIVDAKADGEGDIIAVRFCGNASFTPIKQAIKMADRNEICNAHAVHPKHGSAYIRSNPDTSKNNNLDEMAGDHK